MAGCQKIGPFFNFLPIPNPITRQSGHFESFETDPKLLDPPFDAPESVFSSALRISAVRHSWKRLIYFFSYPFGPKRPLKIFDTKFYGKNMQKILVQGVPDQNFWRIDDFGYKLWTRQKFRPGAPWSRIFSLHSPYNFVSKILSGRLGPKGLNDRRIAAHNFSPPYCQKKQNSSYKIQNNYQIFFSPSPLHLPSHHELPSPENIFPSEIKQQLRFF